MFDATSQCLHSGFDLPEADQVEQVHGCFQGDHPRIILLANGLELPGALELVAPARRDDGRPD